MFNVMIELVLFKITKQYETKTQMNIKIELKQIHTQKSGHKNTKETCLPPFFISAYFF